MQQGESNKSTLVVEDGYRSPNSGDQQSTLIIC